MLHNYGDRGRGRGSRSVPQNFATPSTYIIGRLAIRWKCKCCSQKRAFAASDMVASQGHLKILCSDFPSLLICSSCDTIESKALGGGGGLFHVATFSQPCVAFDLIINALSVHRNSKCSLQHVSFRFASSDLTKFHMCTFWIKGARFLKLHTHPNDY